MKTPFARKEDMQNGKYPRQWWVVDAQDVPVGRLATHVSNILRGKHKPIYTPHTDTGDFVIVVNAEKVGLTGKKITDKLYYHHTGYPGGIKVAKAAELLQKKPTAVVYQAVKGMMAKNALNRHAMHRLKIYAGSSHPHTAQSPKPLEISL